MRHTVFLVLGTDYNNISIDLKKYVMMYGEGDCDNYFHVLNLDCKDGLRTISRVERTSSTNNAFCSGLEDQYIANKVNTVNIKTEEELEHFFSAFYDKTITTNNQGDSTSLNLYLLFPLYNILLWDESKLIIKSLEKIRQTYKINIIGFSDDMSHLFLNEEECKQLPSRYNEFRENTKRISREIVAYKSNIKHRFIMIQNRNARGVSLNLNHDSMIAIIGEVALVCIENYTSIFPLSEECEQYEISAIGLSALKLDKFHFVHYLLRKAYLKVLDRENVSQEEVDINKVSQIAHNSLRSHITLVSDFYNNIVKPLIVQGRSEDEIIVDIVPQLNERIARITTDIQDFINSTDLSLPEKQATLAQILGMDDNLLKGYQYNRQQLSFDDCYAEAVNFYIEENNQLSNRILNTPYNKDGNVYLPLDDLRKLRTEIKESTNYIREKSKELDEIKDQLRKNEQSETRLTENGFTYGNTIYKLLNIEEKSLQENYEPQEDQKESIDLRSLFSDIKDQGKLGTCSVFSIVSTYEYILKKTNREKKLSERFVYYNILNDMGNMEDTGSSLYGVVESMTRYGVCTDNYCKYNVNEYNIKPSEDAYKDAITHKIRTAKNVRINHKDITSALSEGYPVIISLKIYDSFGNSSKGFIFKPTDEEFNEGKFGNHAMVICGYSKNDKVYIVRNSWGKGFGDSGYCYIPFSYIEDEKFTSSACIITTINEGDEVTEAKGIDKQTIVSFNETDMEIRYSIIRVLMDEEKLKLNKNKTTYDNLRLNYDRLIQTLCNNSNRSQIIKQGKERRKEELINDKMWLDNFINRERCERLATYKIYDKKFWSLLLGILLTITIWFICFMEISDWLTSTWNCYLIGFGILMVFGVTYYVFRGKSDKQKLKQILEEEARQKSIEIKNKEEEYKLLDLRLYISGMIIDKLSNSQNELNNKYTLMKSYVGNLLTWYREEQDKVEKMGSPTKEPFISLLSNDILDKYFIEEGEQITRGLYLYEYLNNYNLTEEGIITYKNTIKKRLIEILMEPLKEFNLLSYIQGRNYPYLNQSYSNISETLPCLETKSNYFLHTTITDINRRNEIAKYIFLRQNTQDERKRWNNDYPQYFQNRPSSETIVSPYKLVVFQKVNLRINDVLDLN